MLRTLGVFLTCASFFLIHTSIQADNWPQFRGPNSSGRAQSDASLPTNLGPNQNVLWKTALPPGHSSPAVFGDRVFLTAVRDKRL